MRRFGLLGKDISYSFSRNYFGNKFEKEAITDASYENFDLEQITLFPEILKQEHLAGLNVTIPYKEAVIPFLDKLSKTAKKIGAVNTIKFTKSGKTKGYNTDYYGFKKSLKPFLKPHHKRALILGTGGASKAIAFVFKQLDIEYAYVSRKPNKQIAFTYNSLTPEIISEHSIIVNCTPLGTHPNITDCPDIPYTGITSKHILFDLIYNPSETQFLKHGKSRNCKTINGLRMLELQAEKAWEIWNK